LAESGRGYADPRVFKHCLTTRLETIADNLSKAGWSLGLLVSRGFRGRTIWIVDTHRGDTTTLEDFSVLAKLAESDE
jgi:hypothetical protein